ncbi:MAG: response regulator [Anaerolineae bacterium]|nr:response regulator [Anaerolineae bacterium]
MSTPDLLSNPKGQSVVLVIEDDTALLEDIVTLLELSRFEVLAASSGADALRYIAERHPDVILCDITLPDTDGYTILKTLRENPDTAALPFIFLTGRAERHDVRTGMSLGADDYLTKPFTRDELIAAIQSRLQQRTVVQKAESRRADETWVSAREDERLLYAHLLERQVERTLQSANMILSTAKFAAQTFDKTRLGEIETLLDQAMLYLQEITMDMDARLLEQLGLVSTIYWYLERFNRRYATQVSLAYGDIREKSLPEGIRKQCFRLVQEFCLHLLTAISTATVTIHLEQGDGSLLLHFKIILNPDPDQLAGKPNPEVVARLAELERFVQGYKGTLSISEQDSQISVEVRLGAGGERPIPLLSLATTPPSSQPLSLLPKLKKEGSTRSVAASGNPTLELPTNRLTAAASTPTRVALIGDDQELQAALTTRLRQYPDISVVLTGANIEEAINVGISTTVDVLLTDLLDTGKDDETTSIAKIIENAKSHFNGALVIALISGSALAAGVAAMNAGASALLDRAADADELIAALRLVRSGHRYLGSPYLDEAIEYFVQTQQVFSGIKGYELLTRREQELLWWIASGYTSVEIAQQFSLSPRTVETHRNNIMAKLNLHNRSELTRLSLQLQRHMSG